MSRIHVVTREDADRASLSATLEAAGWRIGFTGEVPHVRVFEWTVEPRTLVYSEINGLGLRVLASEESIPAEAIRWGAPVPLARSGLPDWQVAAIRALFEPPDDELRSVLLSAALDDDPAIHRTLLRQSLRDELLRPLVEDLAQRFGPQTERGAFARQRLEVWNPTDEQRALATAEGVPGPRVREAMREAFHGGDGWLTVVLAQRALEQIPVDPEALAMRGEALRHLGHPWKAAVDLLAARHMAHALEQPEPSFVAAALDATHAVLSLADREGGAGPMSDRELERVITVSSRPAVLRPILEALAPLPHGQAAALAAYSAVLAVSDRDPVAARSFARAALAMRPDDVATMTALALAHGFGDAIEDDAVLELLEEAWRRLGRGPVDARDEAHLGLFDLRYIDPVARVANRTLNALAKRGRHEEAARLGEEARALRPREVEIGTQLGIVYTNLEEHERAIHVYGGVIEYARVDGRLDDPNVALCYFNRACERAITGAREAALLDLAEAIRGRAEFAVDARSDEYLESLRGDPRFEALCRGELDDHPPPPIMGALAPIADALIAAEAAGATREAIGDAVKGAVRGEAPPPALARMPGVPAALAALGRYLGDTTNHELLVLGPIAFELYATGEQRLDEAFTTLAPFLNDPRRVT